MFPIANCDGDDDSSPVGYFRVVFTSQPANAVGVIGGNTSFTFTFISGNVALVTFNWQIQTDGATWQELDEITGFYEGVKTQTLSVKAVDNFLATRTSCNFRCRVVYANSLAFFTTSAALSIPIHTDWPIIATACGHNTANPITTVAATTPTVTGFSGPFTYLWSYVDGDAGITCTNPNIAAPTFTVGYATGQVLAARWICTITSGGNSVTTDPLFVITAGDQPTSSASLTTTFPDPASFLLSWNGVRPDNYFSGFSRFVSQPVRTASTPGASFSTTTVQPNDQVLGVLAPTGTLSPGTAYQTIYFASIRNPPTKFAFYLGALNNAAGGPGLCANLYG